MRNLFLTLVLANLAFAAWHSWFGAETPATVLRTEAERPEILLASELERGTLTIVPEPRIIDDADRAAVLEPEPAGESSEAAPEPGSEPVQTVSPETPAPVTDPAVAVIAAPAVADSARSCTMVGPFRDLAQAATAAANLRAEGFEPVQRVGEGDIWVGYWVYIAAIPSPDAAEEILAKLQANGITDSYVIPNSDSGSLVSLGVFTEIARAGNRLTAVRELGYEATVADRTRRGTVYWIDVLLADGQSLDFDLLQPPGRIVRLEQRPCADMAEAR